LPYPSPPFHLPLTPRRSLESLLLSVSLPPLFSRLHARRLLSSLRRGDGADASLALGAALPHARPVPLIGLCGPLPSPRLRVRRCGWALPALLARLLPRLSGLEGPPPAPPAPQRAAEGLSPLLRARGEGGGWKGRRKALAESLEGLSG